MKRKLYKLVYNVGVKNGQLINSYSHGLTKKSALALYNEKALWSGRAGNYIINRDEVSIVEDK